MQKKLLIKQFFYRSFFKIATVLLLIIFSVSYGQAQTKGLYSFNWQNAALSTVIKQVEDVAKVHFSYNPKDIDLNHKITLKVSSKDITQVVDLIAGQIGANYKIVGETIMMQAIKDKKGAQHFRLSGKVYDGEHSELPGVIITNVVTQKSLSSGTNGDFTIEANEGDSIRFKMVGFELTTIAATEKE